jgi:hypothetical protein
MGSAGAFKPKSLNNKSVQNYAKTKADGKGFDSLSKGGSKASKNYYKKINEINQQEEKKLTLGKKNLLGK